MNEDRIRRSPYLILGVDYGVSAVEANRAFARRVAELAERSLPFGQEDLNWAQTQFRQPEELRRSLRFLRAPIGAARPPAAPERTLFNPPPMPITRQTDPLPADERAELIRAAYLALYERGLRDLPHLAYNPYGQEEGRVHRASS